MLSKMSTHFVRPFQVMAVLVFCACAQQTVSASPFGWGVFGADVPFGSDTSLSIALGGDVALNMVPSGPNFTATSSHTITVTSTDVVGFKLYGYTPGSSTMVNGSETIASSANGSPSSLAVNTWGYNTDASANFMGLTTTPRLLKDTSGPSKSGDNTTVTYSVLADNTKGAGAYKVAVTYTVVAESQ
jgi:hypothetical protein